MIMVRYKQQNQTHVFARDVSGAGRARNDNCLCAFKFIVRLCMISLKLGSTVYLHFYPQTITITAGQTESARR